MFPGSSNQYVGQVLGANSTTQVKKGGGICGKFIPSVTGTIAVYDNANGDTSGTQLLAATTCTAGVYLALDLLFQNGLTVILAGGAAGTIAYN